jgi:predicted transcriptional regulator
MSFPTLNDWLFVLGNKTRREIIRLLTQESHYPFRIAKEISVSQQTVERHLQILELLGIVSKKKLKSTKGPERHYYSLNSSVLLTASIAPNTFDFDITPIPKEAPLKVQALPFLLEQLTEAHSNPDITDTILELLEVLQNLDNRTRSFSRKQAELLFLKQFVLREISDHISETGLEYNRRSMVWSALEHSILTLENPEKEESIEVSIIYKEILTIITEQIRSIEEMDHISHPQETDEAVQDFDQSRKLKSRKKKQFTSQRLLPPASDSTK